MYDICQNAEKQKKVQMLEQSLQQQQQEHAQIMQTIHQQHDEQTQKLRTEYEATISVGFTYYIIYRIKSFEFCI